MCNIKMRTLIHSELFWHQYSQLGEVKILDNVLTGITWALANRPEKYPIVEGTTLLRLAKSRDTKWGDDKISAFRIWFKIQDENCVELLAIEPIEEE